MKSSNLMKKFKILILTDHSKHSAENSLYALASCLASHNQCKELWVASRGNQANNDCFVDMNTSKLHVFKVTKDFCFQATGEQFLNTTHLMDIKKFDVLFLRLPRPISDNFLNYLNIIANKAIFINHPTGIIETSSKAFLQNFASVCPPMKLCVNTLDVMSFANKFPIVLKPLREYGGKGIVKVVNREVYDGSKKEKLKDYLFENKSSIDKEGVLAMKYLKNVREGDKRILVVNGKILGCSLRLPPEDSWLCNVAMGGTSVAAQISSEEEDIIRHINPILQQKGIVYYGADTLVNDHGKRVLSEINTLSIGGFPQAEKQLGLPIVEMAINEMINYINNKYSDAKA